jgi:F-type H+-transporting ATPase subunit b
MISINATLLVQLINLLVLLFILNRLMIRPIRRIIAERAEAVNAGLAEAASLDNQADESSRNYTTKLSAGRREISQRLDALRREKEGEAAEIIADAQKQAQARFAQMQNDIGEQIDQARTQIRQQAEGVARDMAVAILGKGV